MKDRHFALNPALYQSVLRRLNNHPDPNSITEHYVMVRVAGKPYCILRIRLPDSRGYSEITSLYPISTDENTHQAFGSEHKILVMNSLTKELCIAGEFKQGVCMTDMLHSLNGLTFQICSKWDGQDMDVLWLPTWPLRRE